MMKHDIIFDEMNLPLANSNEDLTIISENLFKPFLNVYFSAGSPAVS